MSNRSRYSFALVAVLAFLFMLQVCDAQQLPALVREKTTPLSPQTGLSTTTLFTIPVGCDAGGNIYFHLYNTNYVEEVSPSGEVLEKFSLDSVPGSDIGIEGNKKPPISSFAVGSRGAVYMTVLGGRTKNFIVEFHSDGNYSGVIPLDVKDFLPYHVVAFPTGGLLVTGFVFRPSESGAMDSEAFTGLFDASGKLLAKLSLKGDVSVHSIQQSDTLTKGVPANEAVQTAISTGGAGIGPDGNAYLIRNAGEPQVYVLSPAGELVRRMVLKAPVKGVAPLGETISGTSIVVVFGTPASQTESGTHTMMKPEYYSVYSAATGDLLATYSAPPDLGAFGCYDENARNAFLFVGATPDGHFNLVQASAQ